MRRSRNSIFAKEISTITGPRFSEGRGPAPFYVRSLSPEQRFALRDHLQATLPIEADGSIHLIARAWAVRGMWQD